MKYKYLVCCFLLFSLFLQGCVEERKGYLELRSDVEVRALNLLGGGGVELRNNYVSAAPVGGGRFVVANYVNLFMFDRASGDVCRLSAKDSSGAEISASLSSDGQSFKSDTIYNPTGVFAHGNKVFVANYKANNILVGTLQADSCSFVVESAFASGNTKGPENVAVDEKAGLMFSANYDSGTVVAFDLITKAEVWSSSIPQAHGVAVSNGRLFATGLTERKIYELDIKTGKTVRSKGGLGWLPMASQYMWPTSIYPLDDNRLVLSDPQSGYVSVVEISSLDVVRYTGGNGPSDELFNYPYAAIPVGDELMVLSSMRGDILFLDASNMSVIERFSFSPQRRWPKNMSGSEVPVFGRGWDGYIDNSGQSITISGAEYKAGFGNFYPVKPSGSVLSVPDSGGLLNPGAYIYFIQAYSLSGVDLFFSSSSSTLFGIFREEGYPEFMMPIAIDLDSWVVNGFLISGSGQTIRLDDIAQRVTSAAKDFYSELDRGGWVDDRKLYDGLNFSSLGLSYDDFKVRLDRAFASPAGRAFKLVFDGCVEHGCKQENILSAADEYYFNITGASYVSLEESALVGMVSGRSRWDSEEEKSKFYQCEGGEYYTDYGVEALATETLNDYLSAIDIAGSAVCFDLRSNAEVRGVELVWNDLNTASKVIEIYGRNKSASSGWSLVGRFSDFAVSEENGYALSRIDFKASVKFSSFYIKVVDGGLQNRLIIRGITPVMGSRVGWMGFQGGGDFLSCPSESTYSDFGVESLRSPSLDDYFSSNSLDASSVCFSNPHRQVLKKVSLGWYSAENIGEFVEVFGSLRKDFSSEVSLGRYPVTSYSVAGYYFSDVKVEDSVGYGFYRVKLLKGRGQNRFILRSFSPEREFKKNTKGSEFNRIARAVSSRFHYGLGVQKVDQGTTRTLAGVVRAISKSESAHCGNYALAFVDQLPSGSKWRVFDLATRDGRVHTVVEVENHGVDYIYDPTLGIEYRCSLGAMIAGDCNYASDDGYNRVNPALLGFRGAGFFYGVEVVRMYSSVSELISQYF
ncbi:YncE family protein [Metapseudomonas otitidis]|uniref:YncE family protein n=1 Tax=Metapseudomonas otitidis TaxID=319939 RepID=UPI0013F5BA0B|nr:hypothetical protein [Pseudomonas otitidis]